MFSLLPQVRYMVVLYQLVLCPLLQCPPSVVGVRPACPNPASINVIGSQSNPTSNPGALPGLGTGLAVPDSGALPSSGVGQAASIERSRSRSRARRRRRKNHRRRSDLVMSSTLAASMSRNRELSRSWGSASPASHGGGGRSASVVVSGASGQASSQPAAASSTGNRVSGSRCPIPDCGTEWYRGYRGMQRNICHGMPCLIQRVGFVRSNSHIWHSRTGRALLRSRKECRRLWVQLRSAVQAGPHTQSGMCIDSY